LAKKLQVINREKCTGCGICIAACSTANYNAPFEAALNIENSPFNEQVYKISICYSCKEPLCVYSCPTGYLVEREGGGVKINKKAKCISCGNCVESCPYDFLKLASDKTPLICRQCGLCAGYCPNNCLTMVDTDD